MMNVLWNIIFFVLLVLDFFPGAPEVQDTTDLAQLHLVMFCAMKDILKIIVSFALKASGKMFFFRRKF